MFSYQLNKAVVEVNSDYGSLNSWEMIAIFKNHTTFQKHILSWQFALNQ